MFQLSGVEENRYDAFLKTVGRNVRNIRVSKGLSMENLANEANMEFRQLGRIERGEINTTITSLYKLAEALKVSINDFF